MTRSALSPSSLLVRSPLGWAFRARHRGHLRVLAFHGVDDAAAFRRLMERLVTAYAPVDMDAVLRWLDGEADLPTNATLVTFDDAHPSVLHRGAPVLRELRIPAVVFVVAGLIGGARPPWWEEVEALRPGDGPGLVGELKTLPDDERRARLVALRRAAADPPRAPQLTAGELGDLEAAGVELGNHTFDHPILPRCGDREVEEQIVSAHEAVARISGRPPRAFAYPNGDHDPRAAALLASLGYGAAFLFDHRIATRFRRGPLALSRLRLDASASPERFEQMMSGVHPFLYHVRRRIDLP